MKKFLLAAAILLGSCEGLGIPEEGTIVYDVDVPKADSCEAAGTCDDGSGSDGGSGSGSGSGGTTGGSGHGSGSGGGAPAPTPEIDNITTTPGAQQITVTWPAVSGITNYHLYWSTSTPVSTTSDNFTFSSSTTTFIHNGLTAGTKIYYAINTDNNTALSNESSATPTALTGCSSVGILPDNDTDLILHYAFEGNLTDTANVDGDNRYTLTTLLNGTPRYAQGCAHGQAAIMEGSDGTTGPFHQANVNDATHSNLFKSGEFTYSFWFTGDADMGEWRSLYSTDYFGDIAPGVNNGRYSYQFDTTDTKLHRIAYNLGRRGPTLTDTSSVAWTPDTWYHMTVTKSSDGKFRVYRDGVLIITSSTTRQADQYMLNIGVNRTYGSPWKGYMDEFKLYKRAFTAEEVVNGCHLYTTGCPTLPPAQPDNLTATAISPHGSVSLNWNAKNGTDNYTVFWTNNPSTAIDPANSSTYIGSATVTGTTHTVASLAGTQHDFTVVGNNTNGSSNPATEASATPTSPAPTVRVVTVGSSSIAENGGTATIRIDMDRTASEATVVSLARGGTANPAGDYTFNPTITVPAGSTFTDVTLTGVNDVEVEGNESIILEVDNVTGGNGATERGVSLTTVTITDDDTPVLGSFTITSITPDYGRLQLEWTAPSGLHTGSDYYRLYYTTVAPADRTPAGRAVSSADSVFEPITGDKTLYIHGGLDSSKTYYYRIAAVDVSNSNIITMSDEQSATPKPTECSTTSSYLTDNDADLLVYYPFEGHTNDVSAANGRVGMGHPYNLVAGDSNYTTPTYGAGCAFGSSLYLTAIGNNNGTKNDGFFLKNEDFTSAGNDITESTGWTVMLWMSPDGDMDKFSAMFSTGTNANNNQWQIDVDDAFEPVGYIRTFTGGNKAKSLLVGQAIIGNWYHVVVTWQPDQTAKLYVNGNLQDTKTGWKWIAPSTGQYQWTIMRVGINRNGTTHFKGYVDEIKVYKRTFTQSEVDNIYALSLPPMVDNPIQYQRPGTGHNRITWTSVKGATHYRVWKAEKAGVLEKVITFTAADFGTSDPDITMVDNVQAGCSGTCTYDDTGLNSGKYYYYRVAAVNSNGTGPLNITELRIQAL